MPTRDASDAVTAFLGTTDREIGGVGIDLVLEAVEPAHLVGVGVVMIPWTNVCAVEVFGTVEPDDVARK